MSSSRTAVIVGATGLIGGHCLSALLAEPRYTRVLALGRRKPSASHAKLDARAADLGALDEGAWGQVDDAFCALGTTIKVAGSQAKFREVDLVYVSAFAKAAKAAGATRFVLVSSLGANPQSSVFYNRIKGEAEVAVNAMGFTTTVVLRPSVLDGDRDERRPAERVGIFFGNLLAPLMVGGLQKYRPIKAAKVAEVMVREALHAAPGTWNLESDAISS